MLKYIVILVIIVAGANFSKLFKKPYEPNITVDEVLAETEKKKSDADFQKEQFLSDMSAIESSSGQNTNHKLIKDGMHAGQKAVGQYGFMPKTIKEIVSRMGDAAAPALRALTQVQDEQEMANLVAQDPELEQAVADKLYDHVNERFEGDPEKMSLAWEVGHNSKPESLTPVRVETHPRTEKFRKLRKQIVKND